MSKMKLLRIGKYLINPHVLFKLGLILMLRKIKVCLSCNNSVVGCRKPLCQRKRRQLEKVEDVCLTFIGEEAETLKSYFINSVDIIS
jgi:hypothetical protein